MSLICGFEKFTEMEFFAKEKEDWLKTFLTFEEEIPSHDTFGNIFSMIDAKQFQKLFLEWTQNFRGRYCH
jgi:hypothetical protein